jgi:uncharacterized protein YoxC
MREFELSFNQMREHEQIQSTMRVASYEQSLAAVQREYEELRKRMADLGNDNSRKVMQYENRAVFLAQEIQRLNQVLALKIGESEAVVQNLRRDLEVSRRETQNLQVIASQKYEAELVRRTNFYEQSMAGLARERETLLRRARDSENLLARKAEEAAQLESRCRVIAHEYESLKSQVRSFEGEVSRSHNSYTQSIQQLARENESLKRVWVECDNRMAVLSQEKDRLGEVVRLTHHEQELLRRNSNEAKMDIAHKYELEATQKSAAYEQVIASLNHDREDSKRKALEC